MITSGERTELHNLLDDLLDNGEDIGKLGIADGYDGKLREITIQLDYREFPMEPSN